MKRVVTYLLVAAAAFTSGSLITKQYHRWNIQFRSLGAGSMGMCDDGTGGFSSYESYDGERLTFAKIRFSSEDEARACLESTMQNNGFEVRGREDLLDPSRTAVVGQRVLGHNEIDGADSGFILSQDGDYIVEIASTSLRHALVFENRVRKY